jgi:hypothetical protein
MSIKQLSVFVENKGGRLLRITQILADSNVNILTISIADTTDFGILRFIADDPDKAYAALKAAGIMVRETEVAAISVENSPGKLSEALSIINEENIQIEYMYHFFSQTSESDSILIFRFENQDEAVSRMESRGIKIVTSREIKEL